jgi:hypothetical protein
MHQVLSWHGVPLPASSRRGLAGRKRSFPLAASPGSAHGIFSRPSQVCSRREVNRHLCRSRPTCPFGRDRYPSRFIFVGWISPSIARETIRRLIAIWTSGIEPPGDPCAAPAVRTRELQPLGRRSCLGLCLLQGCGHTLVHPRGLDPARIVNLREIATSDFDRRRFACVRSPRRSAVTIDRCSRPVSLSLQRWRSQSAHGLRRLLPGQSRPGELPPIRAIARSRLAIASSRA